MFSVAGQGLPYDDRMQCTVLFFAQARDLAKRDSMKIELPDNALLRDAIDAIMRAHAALLPLSERLAVAVDERYAHLDSPLHEGCTIALIPPVSGG